MNKFGVAPSLSKLERALLPIRTIHRGDVVVFKYPVDPNRDFIKRVIGLPGETLELRDRKVYIDGRALEEPYAHYIDQPTSPAEYREVTSSDVLKHYGPVVVPADQYFMMGDNRDNSADSRFWGFLPRDYIKGRALLIYWSYEAEPEDHWGQGAGATLTRLASVFVHFFTRTRWDRMLHQIG